MTSLDLWADDVLADPLATARAAPRAIGQVGFDLPLDLLAATGAAVAHLPWDADAATPFAERYVESSFAPWARSIMEQWAGGAFDFLEAVVFSRGDDNAQRLYYYISELQRRGIVAGPRALILDVARIPRESSRERSVAALRTLAAELAVDEAQLAEGIDLANRQRRRLGAIAANRAGPGARYERIARASLFAPVPESAPQGSRQSHGLRILLAGTAPPDDRLHRAVEAAGATIVGEAHERGLDRHGPVIEPDGDPFVALGRHVHQARFGPRSFADPAATLVGEARRVAADAVLLWLIEQEESIVWHVPSQRAALEAAGLSALILTRRRWDCTDGLSAELAAWLGELGR